MVKKKTERLIPQSDQPKKQVSRGKVTVPKNSKQNALSTEKNSLENRKTAKKPTSGKKNSAGQKKQNPQKTKNQNSKTQQKSVQKNGTSRPVKNERKTTKAPGNSKGQSKRRGKKNNVPLKIAFLGGLNEVGKNMTLYECGNDMMLVDCGLEFPDTEMLGVDLVIPDFTYVTENASKIRGIVITHGHEDHIGGLAYLLKQVNIPVYGTRLTIGLIEGKLKEHGILKQCSLNVANPGDHIKLGCFDVELIHVNHSIPDAVALAIKSPAGTVIQTGDFKIDTTPIDGGVIDIARLSQLGTEGVLALLSDSTNAAKPGFTESERKVGETFETQFRKANGRRLIVATFASNIHRVQQIIDVAESLGRKVALSGRSLENVVSIAAEMGYIRIPDGILIGIDSINRYPADKLVIITTGSQGEPMSALYRMAFSEHRRVAICPNDYVIISATPIPGNEKMVGKVVDELLKQGAEVVYEKMYDVHVSGHACQEELKLMMSIIKPKYFIPLHGEQMHLVKHAGLARQMGIPEDNILIASNGSVIEVSDKALKSTETVQAGRVLVDGLGVGDVGSIVLRDRKHLADDGIIIIAVSIDSVTHAIISGPDVVSRGFVYVKESERMMNDISHLVCDTVEYSMSAGIRDWATVKTKIKERVSRYVTTKTRRAPMILPIIMEV